MVQAITLHLSATAGRETLNCITFHHDNRSTAAGKSALAHLVGECLFIHLLTNAYICCLYDMHTMLHYTSTTSGE